MSPLVQPGARSGSNPFGVIRGQLRGENQAYPRLPLDERPVCASLTGSWGPGPRTPAWRGVEFVQPNLGPGEDFQLLLDRQGRDMQSKAAALREALSAAGATVRTPDGAVTVAL